MGNDSTHWRTGTCGKACPELVEGMLSIRSAAVSASHTSRVLAEFLATRSAQDGKAQRLPSSEW